jgi:hypothetical protein
MSGPTTRLLPGIPLRRIPLGPGMGAAHGGVATTDGKAVAIGQSAGDITEIDLLVYRLLTRGPSMELKWSSRK